MVLNMDTELQRLICVSVEKMTREPGNGGRSLSGNGSRKSRGLDLRKALLVAHVLQDMRSAYISDDYKILLNTVCPELKLSSELEMEELRRNILREEYDNFTQEVSNPRKKKFISEQWITGSVERPPRSEADQPSFMSSQYRCPSGTQSCVMTCSDARMSKISQITHPIPVSINTSYVLSHQTSEKDDCDAIEDKVMEVECDGTPAVSEQVEVTSSNESDSEASDTEVVQCDKANNTGNNIAIFPPNSSEETVTVTQQSELCSNSEKSQGCTKSFSCPLPRKKRPLPKEFLEDKGTDTEEGCKRTKIEESVTSSSCDAIVVTSSCYLQNTTTATTLTQSTALSKSNISLSPVSQTVTSQASAWCLATSSVCTTTSVSSSTGTTGPKVVVEKNMQPSFHGLWSWTLPATCTQPRLSQWLIDGVYRSQLSEISKLRDSSIHSTNLGLVAY